MPTPPSHITPGHQSCRKSERITSGITGATVIGVAGAGTVGKTAGTEVVVLDFGRAAGAGRLNMVRAAQRAPVSSQQNKSTRAIKHACQIIRRQIADGVKCCKMKAAQTSSPAPAPRAMKKSTQSFVIPPSLVR